MKILTLIAVYLPGYKAGGPVRTIARDFYSPHELQRIRKKWVG